MTVINHLTSKEYESPEVSVITLGTEAVICLSGQTNKPGGLSGGEGNLYDGEPED